LTIEETTHESWLALLKEQLAHNRYCSAVMSKSMATAHRFLLYLEENGRSIEGARPSDVQDFLKQQLQRHQERRGHSPKDSRAWCRPHSAAVSKLLRLGHQQWPPRDHESEAEVFRHKLCDEYACWLSTSRSLATSTIDHRSARASELLKWLEEKGTSDGLANLNTVDLDNYVKATAPRLRRTTCSNRATCLRSFLRFLHERRWIGTDLADTVLSPPQYAFEDIPSALRPDEVAAALESARKDQTPVGIRDYAILMLLTSYGLRSGEVTSLRLEDIVWRHDLLRIRQSKTGNEILLPLMAPVGEALLRFIEEARPKSQVREVFIRMRAPYKRMRRGGGLYCIIVRRLHRAGVSPAGKHGPHAFRHAFAVNLLRAGVSVKSIGDLLGHRSTDSTAVYLKLATDDLRTVGLNLPGEAK
jgi:integrase/recombinase XerD